MRPQMRITLQVNGEEHALVLEPRRTLLDALRYQNFSVFHCQ
jgi:aerobic-type carbon monoxide dehydrogenase small subunit (CoxS/CutS family)